MKTTVIFHAADYDGLFCREIARKFLPDAELIGWDYGDTKIPFPTDGAVYVLDLSPDCFERPQIEPYEAQRLIWIDHHKSAIEKFNAQIPGYRIDGVAACRLAWQWFTQLGTAPGPDHGLPTFDQFKDRKVSEPLAVRLAGEYDVWDHRDNDADVAFQFGLDSQKSIKWDQLLDNTIPKELVGTGNEWTVSELYSNHIVTDGRAAMQCYAKRDADVMRTRSFFADFEGLKFLCLNTARCNSNTFAALDHDPDPVHDALLAFYWTGKDWSVSMYHAAHRKDLDLSEIAKKFGGGGHRGACGFRAKSLPFIT